MDPSIDRGRLASGIIAVIVGSLVVVFDVRINELDFLLDPAGQLIVLVGIERIVRASGSTPVGTAAVVLAMAAAVLSAILEVAVWNGDAAVGTVAGSEGGSVLGTTLFALQLIGIICLAQHLRRRLDGIASDRWRQVTIGAGVSLGLLPVVLLVFDILLVMLWGAIIITTGVLLLLSLMATRALALDDSPTAADFA